MKKLKIPTNLTKLAYKSIKEYILADHMDESTRLTEEFLSSQLGISKSPIREACNRLEAEGLIRIEPRRGAYLRTLTTKEISDVYGLREALEVHAVRTAQITPKLLEGLKQSIVRMREYLAANNKARYIEEDVEFHAKLAAATGNDHLCSVLENVQNQIWLARRRTYDLSSSTAPGAHEAIVKALDAGDRDAGQRAMSKHIATVCQRLLQFHSAQEKSERAS
jgi:DNA-binding GntR family transcriptional regulator